MLDGRTVKSYISRIKVAIEEYTSIRFLVSPLYQKFSKRLAQQKGVRPKIIRVPASKEVVSAVVSSQQLDLCIRAAVGVAFGAMLRVSEYALTTALTSFKPKRKLLRSDIDDMRDTTGDNGFSLRVKAGKSDIALQGAVLPLMATPSDPLCYVALLRQYLAWRDKQGFAADQPLFLLKDGSPLRRSHVAKALKAVAPRFGIKPSHISTHGLRHGGAMNLRDAGLDWETIMTRGRWSLKQSNAMAVHYSRFSVARNQAVASALALNGPSARLFAHRL
jgi:hypothetical protein